jgi:hypothetical protein
MKVAFVDPESDELTTHVKGTLFEGLTRRLVEAAGYVDVVLRKKQASLEYDIEGRHAVTNRHLTGEAKAHEKSISGQVLSGFIGKFVPRAFQEPDLDGLFVSTSPLTPDAGDYLASEVQGSSMLEAAGASFATIIGDQIFDRLVTLSGFSTEPALRSRVVALTGKQALDLWLVVTPTSEFIVGTAADNTVSEATVFATLAPDGSALHIPDDLLRRIQLQIDDLRDLVHVTGDAQPPLVPVGNSLPTIATGEGWFDYRFPAGADYFIGRAGTVAQIVDALELMATGGTAARTIQILSRSGVGKSSLLVKLQSMTQGPLVSVDGRNLRVPGDIRLAIAQFAAAEAEAAGLAPLIPTSQEQVVAALAAISERMSADGRTGVLQIDQFESLLTNAAVFEAMLDVAVSLSLSLSPIALVLARKNDLAATFDQGAEVDLARLNEMSVQVLLDDFNPEESSQLLAALQDSLDQTLQSDLREALLTFSAGFPWLLKRLCAHVLQLHSAGLSQRDLVQSGLGAEDLFAEEIAGLAEHDKALLRTLAAHLPNTSAELSRRLESEVTPNRLTEKLNSFLGDKLLRLTGNIYDTYNDVFKTYLVTDRVPFQARYVYRMQPGGPMDLFADMITAGPMELAPYHSRVGGSRIAILNKLRELRLLGLADASPGVVGVSQEAQRGTSDLSGVW